MSRTYLSERGAGNRPSAARYRFIEARRKSPWVWRRSLATCSRWNGLDRLSAWPITFFVAIP